MISNSKTVGDVTEGQILAALLRFGKVVLVPFGDNQRYDFVVDENGLFVRIQCKTGKLKRGAVHFSTCSSYMHRNCGKKSYLGEVEFIGVYCPQNDECYMIPIGDCPTREMSLRLEPSKNNQTKNTKNASDYEFSIILKSTLWTGATAQLS